MSLIFLLLLSVLCINTHAHEVIFQYETKPIKWYRNKIRYQESKAGGSPLTNLYATNSVLHKYDQAFGTNSVTVEKEFYHYPFDKNFSPYWWFGLGDGLSVASILFDAPKHSVRKNGVEFCINDIKALLALVASSSLKNMSCSESINFFINKKIMLGERIGTGNEDKFLNPLNIYQLLSKNEEFLSNNLPLIINVGFAFKTNADYDSLVIQRPFDKFTFSLIEKNLAGQKSRFLLHIQSSLYSHYNQRIEFWADHYQLEEASQSGWTSSGPDFAWWFKGQMPSEDKWHGALNRNSSLRLENIFMLYKRSLKRL
ncbi:MAG: hypothetical protein KC505_09605 [Myxococcales bacterium]|nr:hypothetical protein [Myxococcales bacterium]USN51689.1 MAG: hypothetical protein H6731_04585 [Myxococcales bacterium]